MSHSDFRCNKSYRSYALMANLNDLNSVEYFNFHLFCSTFFFNQTIIFSFCETNHFYLAQCHDGEKMELFKSDLSANANDVYLRQEIHQHFTPEERIVLFGHVNNGM